MLNALGPIRSGTEFLLLPIFPNRNFSVLNGNTWTSVFPEFNRVTNQPSVQEQLEISREFCESSENVHKILCLCHFMEGMHSILRFPKV